ncbi:hypothetical protein C2G38_2220678 [Gigaspora rosea]|uniref:Uncharacterized protein n=1 Tax=Gigaspora rosea TaxID=44941 RepID=A0A397UCI4_9GLOM|nr:hypothetical protein C2G38_2220678 [Gigaspora rosea]
MYRIVKGHNVSRCPDAKELEEKCTILLTTFTDEQVAEVQEIINKAFGHSEIHEEQVPEALEFLLEVLEDITFIQRNKVSIPKVRESHYAPETSVEDDDKGLTNEKKNLKKEEAELNLEAVLGDLTNIYLEVLKNQIPEPTKPKEPEPQFKNPRDYKSKIEMLKLDLEDDFDIDEESLPDY